VPRIIALCALVASLLACPVYAANEVASPGTLRHRVPTDVMAYLRVPGPFAMLMAQRGKGIEKVVTDPRVTSALDAIRSAFVAQVEAMPPDSREPLSTLLVGHLTSPIEAVVMLVPVKKRPQPVGLVTMQLDLTTVADVNELINGLVLTAPGLSYLSPMTPGNNGVLSYAGVAAAINFDPATRVLSLVGGTALSQDVIAKLLNLPPNPTHPMKAAEGRVDDTGFGLFAWINAQRMMPFAQMGMPPPLLVQLEQWGLLATRSISIGMGTANSSGKMRLELDVPRTKLLGLLPTASRDISIQSSGEPGMAVVVNGLETDLVGQSEQLLTKLAGPAEAAKFRAQLDKLTNQAGFALEDVLAALGPDSVGFSDSVGEYYAISIRDRKKLTSLLSTIGGRADTSLRRIKTGNVTVHHLHISSAETDTAGTNPYQAMLAAAGNAHLYWVEEDDYLVFSSVPQTLRDRYRRPPSYAVNDWLERNAGGDVNAAALLLSARFDNVPRFIYAQYIAGIQILGDMTGAQIDIFSLPSASELGLPPDGGLSVAFNMGANEIALEASFDGTPFDALAAPSAAGAVAVVGMLAAVAIPAYHDYTTRARVQTIVPAMDPARIAVEVACVDGTLAPGMSHQQLGLATAHEYSGEYIAGVDVVVLSATQASVVARLRGLGSAIENGSTLEYEGVCNARQMAWETGGSIAPKFWPKR
jgi:hypothetical protein